MLYQGPLLAITGYTAPFSQHAGEREVLARALAHHVLPFAGDPHLVRGGRAGVGVRGGCGRRGRGGRPRRFPLQQELRGAADESATGGTGIASVVSAVLCARAPAGQAIASSAAAVTAARRTGCGIASLTGRTVLPLMAAFALLARPECPGHFATCTPVAERFACVDDLAAGAMGGVDRERAAHRVPGPPTSARRAGAAPRARRRRSTCRPGPADRDQAHRSRRLDCDLVRVVAETQPAPVPRTHNRIARYSTSRTSPPARGWSRGPRGSPRSPIACLVPARHGSRPVAKRPGRPGR